MLNIATWRSTPTSTTCGMRLTSASCSSEMDEALNSRFALLVARSNRVKDDDVRRAPATLASTAPPTIPTSTTSTAAPNHRCRISARATNQTARITRSVTRRPASCAPRRGRGRTRPRCRAGARRESRWRSRGSAPRGSDSVPRSSASSPHAQRPPMMPSGTPTTSASTPTVVDCHATVEEICRRVRPSVASRARSRRRRRTALINACATVAEARTASTSASTSGVERTRS